MQSVRFAKKPRRRFNAGAPRFDFIALKRHTDVKGQVLGLGGEVQCAAGFLDDAPQPVRLDPLALQAVAERLARQAFDGFRFQAGARSLGRRGKIDVRFVAAGLDMRLAAGR